MNNENYMMDSPDINQRKLNQKANVQLAPINANTGMNAGRTSVLSMKAIDEQTSTDSHPILRVHNYKKPQLEKLNHPGQG